jgi:hypothetical protein
MGRNGQAFSSSRIFRSHDPRHFNFPTRVIVAHKSTQLNSKMGTPYSSERSVFSTKLYCVRTEKTAILTVPTVKALEILFAFICYISAQQNI